MVIELNDIIKLKKKHPCGSFEWEVMRLGSDIKIKCLGCDHQVMIARSAIEGRIKSIRKKEV